MTTQNERMKPGTKRSGDVNPRVGVATSDPNGPVERIEDPDLAGPPSGGHHVEDRDDMVTSDTPAEEVEAGQASQSGRGVEVPPRPSQSSGRPGTPKPEA
jgi:hypothetical protein